MGFLKRNWEKITTDTVSGLLIRLIPVVLLGLGAFVVVPKFTAQSVSNIKYTFYSFRKIGRQDRMGQTLCLLASMLPIFQFV